jgi:hypothetical protein
MRDRKSRPNVFQEVFGDDRLVLSAGATTDERWDFNKVMHDKYTWVS